MKLELNDGTNRTSTLLFIYYYCFLFACVAEERLEPSRAGHLPVGQPFDPPSPIHPPWGGMCWRRSETPLPPTVNLRNAVSKSRKLSKSAEHNTHVNMFGCISTTYSPNLIVLILFYDTKCVYFSIYCLTITALLLSIPRQCLFSYIVSLVTNH